MLHHHGAHPFHDHPWLESRDLALKAVLCALLFLFAMLMALGQVVWFLTLHD